MNHEKSYKLVNDEHLFQQNIAVQIMTNMKLSLQVPFWHQTSFVPLVLPAMLAAQLWPTNQPENVCLFGSICDTKIIKFQEQYTSALVEWILSQM